MFDLLVTPIVVFFAAPVLILGVVLVALLDGFPVWYRATRVGAGGKPFTMYKIRTMRPISEFRENHETIGDESAMSSIKAESVRVTRVGRVLRRWSIDELPQLFHVVAGTMSLVGPRPRLLDEHSENALLLRRLKVKPGLTGLWQVSGRGDVPLNEAAELDVRYVDSWSLFGDVVILIRTLKTVVTGRGAR
jgi:lipopolysaccharide/colanic/teichoic acid biosynthesis glycosyltransferase